MLRIKWHYKGHRVFKFYRYSFYYYILGIVAISLLGNLIRNFMAIGWSGIVEEPAGYFKSSIIFAGIIAGAVLVLTIPFMVFLFNMQKLCQMAFNSVYYNLEGKEVDGVIVSSQKDMTYFPCFYYRNQRESGIKEVTVKLDGSRYQNRFLNLDDDLGNLFGMDVIGRNKKYWYMKYTLCDVVGHRLDVSKVDFGGIKESIPLMQRLKWNYIKTPHVLITGNTGSGKTYLMLYLVLALAEVGELYIVDPKRADLFSLHRYAKDRVMSEPGGVLPMLRDLNTEMKARYNEIENRDDYKAGTDYRTCGMAPVFLIFDEFIAFIDSLNKKEADEAIALLHQVGLKGRQAGVYLILGTQRADSAYLTGVLRDVLNMRVALGSMEAEGYRMTFGKTNRSLEKREDQHGYIFMNGVTTTVRELSTPEVPQGYDIVKEIGYILRRKAKES